LVVRGFIRGRGVPIRHHDTNPNGHRASYPLKMWGAESHAACARASKSLPIHPVPSTNVDGAGSRIRTDDRLITNQLLAMFWVVLGCSPLTTKKDHVPHIN
jgi:hypothetical protein